MRRTIPSLTLFLLCLLFFCVTWQASAQSSGGTVYYCASSWSNSVVYFSAPFETDELVRNNIQQAYFQFLKQKYSYPGDAPDVVCSISETLTSAKIDRAGDEASVKRANHSVTETTWTYRGAVPAAPAAAPSRASSPAATSHVASTTSHAAVSAPPAAASAPAVASPAAGPALAAAPGQHWWLCQYRDPKDPYKPVLGMRIYFALFPSAASVGNAMMTHFSGYVQQNYKVNPPGQFNAGGYCQRYSDDAATRANSMDMNQKQWASGNLEAIQVDFADTPAQDAAIDAKLAGAASQAATAAATPTAAANQNYVWCHSAWAGTVGTKLPAGTVLYFSDIFPADMPPPLKPTPGHPLPPNANSAQINRTNALQASFFALFQKKYGYKDSGNYPVSCSASDPPTLAGLQNAQKNKQDFEDMTKQLSGQVVETGWKNN